MSTSLDQNTVRIGRDITFQSKAGDLRQGSLGEKWNVYLWSVAVAPLYERNSCRHGH
jgi:hypothetical protein